MAGTLVLTTVGMVAIENLQPGDMVYAMEDVCEEQSVDVDSDIETKAIFQTYVHETDETYVVTVDGEDIETTAEHPFYNAKGEQVAAKELQEGDSVTTADGDTATVDAVTCIHHDEPVKVYNIAVCDDHTYFVGETHVLVHNACQPNLTSASEGGSGTNADFIVSSNGVVVDSKIGVESIPETKFTTNKLQHEFSHASDFGIEGNWNSAKGIKYQNAIQNNINNATDIYISKYRGTDVYVYYNSNTGLGSYVDYLGNYVGGWKFSANQLNYHIANGLKIY